MANKKYLRKHSIPPPTIFKWVVLGATMHVTTSGEMYGVQAKGDKDAQTTSTRNTPRWWAPLDIVK